MTALAANHAVKGLRDVYERLMNFGVDGGVHIFSGAMVAIKADGTAMPAGLAAGGSARVVGVADHEADATGLADNAVRVNVKRGVFAMLNHGADLVAEADRGVACYVVDDQTVAKTDGGSGARIKAGIVEFFEGGKVFVRIGVDV